MATSPSFASSPTIIWPGKAKHASCKNPGFVTAAVPIIAESTPLFKKLSTVSIFLMPPPS